MVMLNLYILTLDPYKQKNKKRNLIVENSTHFNIRGILQ